MSLHRSGISCSYPFHHLMKKSFKSKSKSRVCVGGNIVSEPDPCAIKRLVLRLVVIENRNKALYNVCLYTTSHMAGCVVCGPTIISIPS